MAISSKRILTGREKYQLKAVIIPQKFYLSTNSHSTNPTLGIGVSLRPSNTTPIGVTFGAGFNKVTLESNGKEVDKTGLSIFWGYDFHDFENDLTAGFYIGLDSVNLKSNELFNNRGDDAQTWFGLVFSISFD